MRRTLCLSVALLALFALLGTLPAWAGTVYVPVLNQDGVSNVQYVTRVWLTNEATSAQTVKSLLLPLNSDGTVGRDNPDNVPTTTTVRPGSTVVLQLDGPSGLLEISTNSPSADQLAVNAEVRNPDQAASVQTHDTVPVLTSKNLTDAGNGLTLQGLRRTDGGVFTNVILVNLGHDAAQCTVKVFRAGGQQIASTALVSLKALSAVQFADALQLLGEGSIQDVYAQVYCDQPFYGFLTKHSRETNEVLINAPSVTADSTLTVPGTDEPAPPSTPGAIVFSQSGTFHIPTPADPSKIYNIAVPDGSSFSNVIVDFDFYQGGWFDKDPSGLHSLFWLHRGAYGGPGDWPKWPGNITAFANVLGPSKNDIKMVSNMNLPRNADKSKGDAYYALQPGQTYHVHFEYDTTKGKATLTISQNGNAVTSLSMPTTVKRLYADSDDAWMIYFGHENQFGTGNGAERPTYGWKYQNLRVEFIP